MPGSAPPPCSTRSCRCGCGGCSTSRAGSTTACARRSCCSPSPHSPVRRAVAPRESVTWAALGELAVGILVGVAVGAAAGFLLGWSRQHGFSSRHTRPLAVAVLPLLAYFGAEVAGGNAFVVRLRRRHRLRGRGPLGSRRRSPRSPSPRRWPTRSVSPSGSRSASSRCPCSSSTSAGPRWSSPSWPSPSCGWGRWPWRCLAPGYARRPSPSSAGSARAGWRRWSSPCWRLEGLDLDEDLVRVISAICLTVLLSVLAHGFSADPLSRRYGAWVQGTRPDPGAGRLDRAAQSRLPAPARPGHGRRSAGLTASGQPSTTGPRALCRERTRNTRPRPSR